MSKTAKTLGLCMAFVIGSFACLYGQQKPDLSADQETECMDFVGEHHPELVHLLELLKSMKREEYDSAIREIQRVRKRLEQLEKRDPILRELELEGWKIQSQIDLMLARAVVQEKEFDRNLLRPLVEKKIRNQRKHLEAERAVLAARQKQLDDSIQRAIETEQDRVNQQLATFLRKIDSKKSNSARSTRSGLETNRGTK